jgi:hypothetical protein
VSDLAQVPPSLTVAHRDEVALALTEFAEDDHARSVAVDGRALVEELVGRPGVGNLCRGSRMAQRHGVYGRT